jgi:uncharacterized protein
LPERTCIGCRKKKEKKLLLKIVLDAKEGIRFSFGRNTGRGAYLCPDIGCMEKAWKRKSFARSLKINTEIIGLLSSPENLRYKGIQAIVLRKMELSSARDQKSAKERQKLFSWIKYLEKNQKRS